MFGIVVEGGGVIYSSQASPDAPPMHRVCGAMHQAQVAELKGETKMAKGMKCRCCGY